MRTIVAGLTSRSRRPGSRAIAAFVAVAASLALAACGAPDAARPAMADATCGIVVDASGSANELLRRSQPLIRKFVVDNRCGSVQMVAVSANSVGDPCTAKTLDLVGEISAHPSNPKAWEKEYREDQVPRVSAASMKLAQCVAQRGTSGGTDVFGALTQLHQLVDPVHVLLVSDLVNTVGLDLTTAALGTSSERAKARATVDESRLLPPMAGWKVDAVGGSFNTASLGPERSAQIQEFFKEAVESRGGTWHLLAP